MRAVRVSPLCRGLAVSPHVDPAQKRFQLSLKGLARALDTVREEAQKCVLLCATCHAEVEVGFVRLTAPRTGRG